MIINEKEYFIISSSFLSTNGFKRTILFNVIRKEIKFIPNSLYYVIRSCQRTNLKNIYKKYLGQEIILDEYFKYLIDNEIGFYGLISDYKLFSRLSTTWDFPSLISNSIIDINTESKYNFESVLKQLDKLHVFHIQIRFFSIINNEKINAICDLISGLSFRTIEIILPFREDSVFETDDFFLNNRRVTKVMLFNTHKEYLKLSTEDKKVVYLENNITDSSSCGAVHSKYFSATIEHYTESLNLNTCLNRKICIDENGEIKNCPAMKQSFGNIKDTTLEEALNKPGFKDLWGIRKDDIDVCKDCEFRYMCTDCRAFIKDPENIYSQPAKCPYNPYIAKWEGEEGYITVEKWRAQNPNWEKKAKRYPLVKNPQKVE